MSERPGNKTRARVWEITRDGGRMRSDHLATEEPLEIRLIAQGVRQTVAVTMRTPGNDFELAAGFLHGEGVIAGPRDIARISYCVDPAIDAAQQYNIVNVSLRGHVVPDLAPLERHFSISSACGVCGKASLEALQVRGATPLTGGPEVAAEVLYGLPSKLSDAQRVFQQTGGLHAAALFDVAGNLIQLREDVGRHNALDKLIGALLRSGRRPQDGFALVTSRASFEMAQKAAMAGIPLLAAISAPTALAVRLAQSAGLTLVGFARGQRHNVYAHPQRLG